MWPMPGGLPEATLTEVFAIYRAFDRSTVGWDARPRGNSDISTPPPASRPDSPTTPS
jgi:hypothetical protein